MPKQERVMEINSSDTHSLDNSYDYHHFETGEGVVDLDTLIGAVNRWAEAGAPVNDATAVTRVAATRDTQFPTAAAPDFPAIVGWGLVGIYATIMLDFVLFFTLSRTASMMISVGIAYFAVYLTIPVAFFQIERKATGRPKRISLTDFMERGVDTWTSHVKGWEAIAQIFAIPTVLAVALFAIGIIWQAAR
jgi:hypothetical protein